MPFCKTSLLPLRVMLFSFYGGISCVLPFVTLHMSTLGFTKDQLTWLQFILPFVSCVGPLLGGVIADKLRNYKPVLVVALLVCAAAYPCMMLVPKISHHPARTPELSFVCSGQGSALVSESCHGRCARGDTALRGYYIEKCVFACDDEVPVPSGLPHLCLDGVNRTVCEVVADVGDGVVVNASLPRVLDRPESEQCWYPLVDYRYRGEEYRSILCRSPPGCRVSCGARQLTAVRQLFSPDTCPARPRTDAALTFWLYFGLRAATEACLPLALVLINATALLLRHVHDSDFGWEFLWALLGFMTFAPFCGYLIDVHHAMFKYLDFRPSFYVFCALMLICVILASVVPIRPIISHESRGFSRLLAKSFFNLEFFSVLCVLLILGTLWGFLETFLYEYVRGLEGTQLQNGLSLAAGTLLLLPFLIKTEPLVNYCGHHHIFIIAFILYIVRYVSYAYIGDPWLVLLPEALEMFTLHMSWLTAVLFTSSQGSPVVEATMQGVITAAHFGIGRGLGAGVVRYVLPRTTPYMLLCAGSVLSAAVAIVYMLLYYCCRHCGRRRRPYGRHRREMYSTNGAMMNGSYSALKNRR